MSQTLWGSCIIEQQLLKKHLSTLQNLLQNIIRHRSWLSNIKEKVIKNYFARKDFYLYHEKDQTESFYFLMYNAFEHQNEFLKATYSTSKGSPSNSLQIPVLKRYVGKMRITSK